MRIRKIGATLVVAGLFGAGASALATERAAAASTTIAMLCKQSPNITGDIAASFAISFDAPNEVESGAGFSISDIEVPFTNNQAFDLDIGPGTVTFTAPGVVPDLVQRTFGKVAVPIGDTTVFGPFDLAFGGSGPGEVTVSVENVVFDVALTGGNKLTTVTCTPTGSDDLHTVDVVLPPPPGAPNANPDTAEVKPGESVTIAVLNNDEAADFDEPRSRVSLGEVTPPEIMDSPSEGTVEIEADGTVTYTADADTTATSDSFDYRICTEFELVEAAFGRGRPAGTPLPCDTTTVSINIVQPQATTVPPTTSPEPTQGTSASSVSPTTDELPVTGSGSTPLGVLGFVVALVGVGLLALSRRHAALR